MNTKPCLLKLVTLFALLSHAQLCFATPPSALNYQGHLTDNNGMPANGIVAMTFRLYDVSVGGIPLWFDT